MKKKVLVVVKAYPSISKSYGELVCTAGIDEKGAWVRIYPLPFRRLEDFKRVNKYSFVEMDLVRNNADIRPGTFKPPDIDNLKVEVMGHLGTNDYWRDRKKYLLKKVYTDMDSLIAEAKDPSVLTSIAVFKPKLIKNFYVRKAQEKVFSIQKQAALKQANLFEDPKTMLKENPGPPLQFLLFLR